MSSKRFFASDYSKFTYLKQIKLTSLKILLSLKFFELRNNTLIH